MPTYEYECDSCGILFERLQRFSDEPIRECPECGGKVRRLISSGGGLVFKGPGFYATDYGSGSSGSSGAGSAASKEPGKGADESKGGGKSESAGGSGDDGA
jgi:putative FmdB family regulatory protein